MFVILMKPVVKLRGREGKIYIPTLPILPDEVLIKIAEQESVIKPEKLKRTLYGEGVVRVNNGNAKRRLSNIRRKLSHLKIN